MSEHLCTVDGCGKPARSSGSVYCQMHYHRWYRHGDVDRSAREATLSVSHGRHYRRVYRPGHPQAGPDGHAYEHRVVLFDAIGPGTHTCHWCGTEIGWDVEQFTAGALEVDHLNHRTDDNRAENLVPSCRPCNVARGQQARADALRAAGWWSNHDTVAVTDGRLPRLDREQRGA